MPERNTPVPYVAAVRMEQPANSLESSRPDGAEPASGAEGATSATEHKEEKRLDSEALIVAANRG